MLCTIQDDLGWLAWKGWNLQVFGQGDTEEEAIADLAMCLERMKRWSSEPWKSWSMP